MENIQDQNKRIRGLVMEYKKEMSRLVAEINRIRTQTGSGTITINPEILQRFNERSQQLRSATEECVQSIKSYFQDQNTQKQKLLDRVIYEKGDLKSFLYTFAYA